MIILISLLLLLYNLSLVFPDDCATHLRTTHRRVRFSRPQGLDSRIPWQAWRTDRTNARGTTCPRTAGRLPCPDRRAVKDVGRGRVLGGRGGEEPIHGRTGGNDARGGEEFGVGGASSIKWKIHTFPAVYRATRGRRRCHPPSSRGDKRTTDFAGKTHTC